MSLEKRIMEDMKTAMKAKDQVALRSIRALKSAIILQKTDGSGTELDDAGEIKMVQKLIKQRQDSLEIFEKQEREDLAQVERDEIEVLQRYLPEQMSQEKLEAYLQTVIDKTGATSMRDMGKIMGIANKELAGKADGKTISTTVKDLLSR